MALLANGLLPASFRGAPFAVFSDSVGGGRRQAVHVYPGRDTPWAEDMGRAPRTFRFRGFIVDGDILFAGGPIALQRALLLAALEREGSGTLTHPSLGILNVSVIRFDLGADLGAGRMSTIDIEFIESGKRSFPSLLSQSSGLLTAANLCKAALVVDGIRLIALAASVGGQRSHMQVTASAWSSRTLALGADATALHRLAAQLPGNNGRFAGGGNDGINGVQSITYSDTTTVADLTVIASKARASLSADADAMNGAFATADLTNATPAANAVIVMVQAMADACADPGDAIRLLLDLIAYGPVGPEASTAIGQATSGMVQRAAVASLALAAGQYQPSSADDAAILIRRIADAIDVLATSAADAGDDESFKGVRAVRAAIVQDLRARSATLAQITTLRPGSPLPALFLAQRYYRDPARADQLVTQARPAHPLFMPPEFQALAS